MLHHYLIFSHSYLKNCERKNPLAFSRDGTGIPAEEGYSGQRVGFRVEAKTQVLLKTGINP